MNPPIQSRRVYQMLAFGGSSSARPYYRVVRVSAGKISGHQLLPILVFAFGSIDRIEWSYIMARV